MWAIENLKLKRRATGDYQKLIRVIRTFRSLNREDLAKPSIIPLCIEIISNLPWHAAHHPSKEDISLFYNPVKPDPSLFIDDVEPMISILQASTCNRADALWIRSKLLDVLGNAHWTIAKLGDKENKRLLGLRWLQGLPLAMRPSLIDLKGVDTV